MTNSVAYLTVKFRERLNRRRLKVGYYCLNRSLPISLIRKGMLSAVKYVYISEATSSLIVVSRLPM
jgi:hypothetical protein